MSSQPTTISISTSEIVAGNNDRTIFDPVALRELADSIAANGLIQPVTVRRPEGTDFYEIVVGERRFRACRLLGWTEITANVVDATDEEAAAMMLAENVGREDLDPIDEALAYDARIRVYGWSVDRCAEVAGVSTVMVNRRLKLLRLREDLREMVRSGNLSVGYAEILSGFDLDLNRQMLAVSRLRDNPHPTNGWFRAVLNELKAQQEQGDLFGLPLMGGALDAVQPSASLLSVSLSPDPPHPSTTKPPKVGNTMPEIVMGQASFWERAAQDWHKIGKPYRRNECEAAARAVQAVLEFC